MIISANVYEYCSLVDLLEDFLHFLVMNPYVTLFFNATSVVVLISHFRYLCIIGLQEEYVISYDP
jgi:hypothetical protein